MDLHVGKETHVRSPTADLCQTTLPEAGSYTANVSSVLPLSGSASSIRDPIKWECKHSNPSHSICWSLATADLVRTGQDTHTHTHTFLNAPAWPIWVTWARPNSASSDTRKCEVWGVMPLMCDLRFLSPNAHASICALGWIKNEEEQRGKEWWLWKD